MFTIVNIKLYEVSVILLIVTFIILPVLTLAISEPQRDLIEF